MVSSFAEAGPSFFKIILDLINRSHHVRIPASFKGIIGERFPCTIYLKGSSGHRFKVLVWEDVDGNIDMQEGWKDFMLANEISMTNFLVFTYDGNLNFYVRVFNFSGIERMPKNQEQHQASGTSGEKRKPGRPRKYAKEDQMLQDKGEGRYQDFEKEPTKKIPALFKVFSTEDTQKRLNIPLAFTEYIEGIISFTAFLKDHRRNVWTVETTKSRGQYYFDYGWPKFVEENNVQFGDFLIFQYDGKCTFDFKHFGSSMCEKEPYYEFKVNEEDEERNDKETEPVEKQYANLDNFGADVDIADDNEDDDHEEKDDVVVEEKEVTKKEADDDDANNEEKAIFESGIVERPKINPYFVAKINPSRRSDLSVPSDVIKDFNLKLPENLIILDGHGRRWMTKVKVWKDGRTSLSKGWRPFCKRNKVELNDRCLCEFVPGDGEKNIFLQICIVRAGSW